MTAKLFLIGVAALLLGACVYSPYETAFEACDNQAGACYRSCGGEIDDANARACRRLCDDEAGICFDRAYAPYNYSTSPNTVGSAWYGYYGFWAPRYGYRYAYDQYYYGRPSRYSDPYFYDPYYADWTRYRSNRRSYRRGYYDGYTDYRYRDRNRDRRDRRRNDRGRGRDNAGPPPTPPRTRRAVPPVVGEAPARRGEPTRSRPGRDRQPRVEQGPTPPRTTPPVKTPPARTAPPPRQPRAEPSETRPAYRGSNRPRVDKD